MTAAHLTHRPASPPPHDDRPPIPTHPVQPPETEHNPVREALMPVVPDRTSIAGRTRAVALLGVATVVVAIYVALPLVLVLNGLLHALPNAVAATGGLVILAVTGIATVLVRTTSNVEATPEAGDIDPRREFRAARHAAAPRHAAPRPAGFLRSLTVAIPWQRTATAPMLRPLSVPVPRRAPTATPPNRAQAGRGAHRWVEDGNRAA
jgi:hypothetical protein